MVYGRGIPADYEGWVSAGNAGWGWEDMLPFFRRMEHWNGPTHPSRGTDGPLEVRRFEDTEAACSSAMNALIGQGVPEVADYSIGITEGIGLTQATQKRGWRHSAADAYLDPARRRANLTVLTHTRAVALLLAGRRCAGVRVARGRTLLDLHAARETLVCAGAIGSPSLLLRSGIGSESSLAPHGIAVAHLLPGVGEGLNDHVNIKLSAFVSRATYNTQRRGVRGLRHGLRFLRDGTGPASSPANHCQAFVRTDASLPAADVQIQLMPLGFGSGAQMRRDGMTAVVSLCRPEARGRVRLRSADPADPPRITMAMLESARDREALLEGCRRARAALEDGPGRSMRGRLYAPAPGTSRDVEWLAFFRASAALNWHPTSTCRMGNSEDAVVDTRLRLRGLDGVRVVDASVMPTVTSANTNRRTRGGIHPPGGLMAVQQPRAISWS
jgi:choline dehydrogenase